MYARRRRNPGSGRENPERQFWEKVFLLRVETYREGSSAECAGIDADKALESWKRRFPDRLRDSAQVLLEACIDALDVLENDNDDEEELRNLREKLRDAREAAEGPKVGRVQ